MSGFNDSIVGGMGKLIRALVESPNYVPGVSGWAIKKDGSAEFNNLTVRNAIQTGGTITGTTILGYAVTTPRGPFFQSFEGTTGGWSAVSGTLAVDTTVFATDGVDSLALTCNGGATPKASSPAQACVPFDPVSVAIDVFTTATLNAQVGIDWFSDAAGTVLISSSVSGDVALANTSATIKAADNAPSNALSFRLWFEVDGTPANGTIIYGDNVNGSGNLAFSASPTGGTDSVGNHYNQGIGINGLSGLTSAFTVQDAFGQNTLASIDGSGNVTGQLVTASQDAIVGGDSLLSTIIPGLSQGEVARTNVFASSLPAPAVATTAEFFLYELDFQSIAGRSYLLVIEEIQVALGSAGKVSVNVYGTTDGTQPTSASTKICTGESRYPSTSNLTIRLNPVVHQFASTAGALWRFLVSLNSTGVDGGAAPTIQVTQLGANPGDDAEANTNARFSIYDMGLSIPNTGRVILATASGSGGGTTTKTKTYTATHTYSYSGSDGTFPNSKLDTDGKAYQGGDVSHTFNGKSKTWIKFDSATIAADLAGSTINSVKLKLNNNHSWFFSGMTVSVGWDTKSSFGSTAGDPSGHTSLKEYHINDGATLTQDIGTQFGVAFRDSGATTIVLFKNSNNLNYYGYFAGAGESGPPQLIINYTK